MKKSQTAIFLRALAVMFSAGVPIHRALHYLAQQFEGRLGQAAGEVGRSLASGTSLPQAMRSHPDVFSRLQVRMLEVGVRTGGLGSVLDRLATYEERHLALQVQARSALTYPAIVFALCLGLVVLLPPFVLHDLLRMLASSGVPQPAPTRVLILFSGLVRSPWFGLALLALVAGLLRWAPTWLARPGVRLRLRRGLLGMKAVGPALRALAVARFSRALETTTAVGLPLQEGLRLAAAAAGDPVLEEAGGQVLDHVLEGEPLSAALERSGYFPRLFVLGLRVGEEAGRMDQALKNMASLYELELESRLDTLTALLEPLATGFIGACVGALVLATMLPLSRLLGQL